MSQISPPIRVVLVAALALLAAWMLVLRPKAEETPPAASAAVPAKQPGNSARSAAGKAVQAAANARATAESAAGESTAPAATATPAATLAVATLPGVDPAALRSLPRDVRAALLARKIVVLGFFDRDAAD